jgi:uncharacterized membrane protein
VHVVLLLVLLAPRMGWALVRTAQPGGQVLRASLLLGSTLCNFFALSYLPLAEVKAISFVSPLLVTVFAVWLLREKVTLAKWIAVMVGFLGTLFIVRPGSHMLSWASSLALGNALCYSLYQIMTRQFSEDETPLATLFYSAIVGCVVLSLVVPWVWVQPSGAHLGLFLLVGSAGAAGHFMLIKALERARLGAVADRLHAAAVGDAAGLYRVRQLPTGTRSSAWPSSSPVGCTWPGVPGQKKRGAGLGHRIARATAGRHVNERRVSRRDRGSPSPFTFALHPSLDLERQFLHT